MKRVMALQGLEHYGTRRRGQVFEVSPETAAELVRRGLVAEVKARGAKSPAKPAKAAAKPKPAKAAQAAEPKAADPTGDDADQ